MNFFLWWGKLILLGKKRFVNQENFALSKNIKLDKKVIIHSIIPSIDKENLYYGTYFTSKNRKRNDVENLVYTYSLKSNEWYKVKNSKSLILYLILLNIIIIFQFFFFILRTSFIISLSTISEI